MGLPGVGFFIRQDDHPNFRSIKTLDFVGVLLPSPTSGFPTCWQTSPVIHPQKSQPPKKIEQIGTVFCHNLPLYSDGQSLRTYFGKKNLNITAFFTF